MNIPQIARQIEKFTIDNSPAILTGIGVTGVVATAYLTGKASVRAYKAVQWDLEDRKDGYIKDPTAPTPKQIINIVWRYYVPPVLSGTATIAAIVAANQIGTKRAAALAAAYSLSQKAFDEYKEKVVKTIGDKKEQSVREQVAQDRIDQNPPVQREIILTGRGNVLVRDNYSGRYFKSDMESLKKAQNDLNYKINNQYYQSLNDFYDLIGLGQTRVGEEVGWNSDKLMELDIQPALDDNGEPCLSMEFQVVPIRNYFRVQ